MRHDQPAAPSQPDQITKCKVNIVEFYAVFRLNITSGRLKNRARDQRRLMLAGVALKNLVAAAAQDTVCCTTTAVRTARTWGFAKTIGPACALQGRRAKCFGAKELEELRYRQAGLKPDAFYGHNGDLKTDTWVQIVPSQVHQVDLAEDCF